MLFYALLTGLATHVMLESESGSESEVRMLKRQPSLGRETARKVGNYKQLVMTCETNSPTV